MLILIFFLILSVILNIIGVVAIKRLFAKQDVYQDIVLKYDAFYTEVQNRLTAVLNTMHAIDVRGSFKSDDEVGSVFDQMKMLISALDVFLDGVEEERKNERSS